MRRSSFALGCPPSPGRSLQGLGADAPAIINWNTTPNTSADGRKVEWGCADWMNWHKKLVIKGKERGWSNDTITFDIFIPWWIKANKTYLCSYNTTFYDYFKSYGITGSFTADIAQRFLKAGKNVTESVANAGENVAQTVENISNTGANTTKTLSWLLPAVLVAGVIGVGVIAYKTYAPKNTVQTAK